MTQFDQLDAYLQKNLDASISELSKLVAQPSVAAQNRGLEETARLVAEMLTRRGFKTKILPTGGAPVVVAELMEYNEKTLLFYNHYTAGDTFKSFDYDNPSFLPGSLVILGGSRRPDLSPLSATQFIQSHIPQTNWLKVYEVTGRKRIWRKENLVIYRILGE